MDAHPLLLVALAIGPLVGGVVGFGLQLRQLRVARLQNEKVLLEIAELRRRAAIDQIQNEKLKLEVADLAQKGTTSTVTHEMALLQLNLLKKSSAKKGLLVSDIELSDVIKYGMDPKLTPRRHVAECGMTRKEQWEDDRALFSRVPKTPPSDSHSKVASRFGFIRFIIFCLACYGAYHVYVAISSGR